MGIVITDGLVTIDHGINSHLITSEKGNPKHSLLKNNLAVTSVFTRLKSTGAERSKRQSKKAGDNCPLIYAFKGLDGLHTNAATKKELLRIGLRIFIYKIKPDLDVDSVISMPSSSNLSLMVGAYCAREIGVQLSPNIFLKTDLDTAFLTLEKHKQKGIITYSEYKSLAKRLNRRADTFFLKNIPPKYRHLFSPLVLNKENCFKGRKVLLVDDLLSTGTTLSIAADILRSNYSDIFSVQALCLFSDV